MGYSWVLRLEFLHSLFICLSSALFPGEIEKLGDTHLREVIRLLGGWPVISFSWENETNGWVLEKVIGSLRGVYNIALLIDFWVAADDKNSSINVITVSESSLQWPTYVKDCLCVKVVVVISIIGKI